MKYLKGAIYKLSYFIYIFMAIIVRTINYIICSNKNRNVILCPPPALMDVKGDEALLSGALNYLIANNANVYVILTSDQKVPDHLVQYCKNINDKLFTLFYTDRCFFEMMSFIFNLINKNHFLLIGADLMDGRYGMTRPLRSLDVANIATSSRVKSRIISASFSSQLDGLLKERFIDSSKRISIMVRDELSVKRLNASGVNAVHEVLDVAFLLGKTRNISAKNSINEFIADGSKVIVINISPEAIANYISEDVFIKNINYFCDILIIKKFKILLLVHNDPYDKKILDRISLNFKNCESVYYLDNPETASFVKYLVSRCYHVFSGRMHLSIAAIGVCTPVSVFPYGGKFHGLFDKLNLSSAVIDNIPQDEFSFADLMFTQLSRNNEYRNELIKCSGLIERMAKKNFDGMFS